MLFELLRGAVRRARIAGTMSSTALSIGLEPAYYTPQRPNLVFNLTNAFPRGHRCCFECSQSGSLGDARTGSRSAVVANRRVVARPRTFEFPVSALLAGSCAFAHAALAPTVFRHGGLRVRMDQCVERTKETGSSPGEDYQKYSVMWKSEKAERQIWSG